MLSNTKAVALLYDSAYFGYSDIEENGTWKWVNGETPVYSNWNVGEPSDGFYAMYYWKWQYTWNDGTFDSLTDNGGTALICEWEDAENTDFVQVSLGGNHSAAITKNGSLYLWGSGSCGALGNGNSESSYTPVKILDNVKSVSLGNSFSAAITEDGSLYMWGWGSYGQLGNGTKYGSSTPEKIMDDVALVSLGVWHTAAVKTSGELYVWGMNQCWQLGNRKDAYCKTPKLLLSGIALADFGGESSAAVTKDGRLYMWGDNEYYQLNTGKLVTSPEYVNSNVAEVSVGYHHTAVIKKDGSLYLWGKGKNGQLGIGSTPDESSSKQVIIKTEASATSEALSLNSAMESDSIEVIGFTNLVPNSLYNIYIMKSRIADNPFSSNNLLYIDQAISSDSGQIVKEFGINEYYPNYKIFAVGIKAAKSDISAANVTIPDLSYTGTEQLVDPTVTLDGKTLTEGVDYMLCGDYSAVDAGTYTVEIVGMGGYCGSVLVSYNVIGKQETPIEAFVERLYINILNRPSDPSKVTHIDNLNNGESACKVAFDFVFSSEFANLPISNEERVRRMYLTFLNREADPAGLADWTEVLNNGCSIGHIFHGFTQSNEFTEICEAYGINRGTWECTENRDRSSKLTAFVSRLYTKAMGRNYDVNGLNDHTGNYLANRDLYQLAYNFIFSQEFIEKNLSDEDFVDVMYRTFFDREADPAGKADWIGRLRSGCSREEVLAGFVGSQECAELVARFGI